MKKIEPLAVLTLIGVSLGGCAGMIWKGPSSADRKEAILKESFLSAAEALTMRRGKDHLEKNGEMVSTFTRPVTGAVFTAHRTRCTQIEDEWEVALDCDLTPDFELADLGGPYVQISGTTIRMDPEVIRVVFEEVILRFLREGGVPEFKRPSSLPDSPTDKELVRAFSDLWQEVEAAPVSHRDGVKFAESPTKAQAEEQAAWDRLDGLRHHFDTVHAEVWGGSCFLLAHALGHLVLGHEGLGRVTMEEVRRAEEDADAFAARMFTALFQEAATAGMLGSSGRGDPMEYIESFYSLPGRLTDEVELAWYPARPELPALISPQPDRIEILAAEYEKLLRDVRYREMKWTKLSIGWE